MPPAEVSVRVTHDGRLLISVNEYWSKDRPPAPNAPGHALAMPHELTTPLRPSRPAVESGSAGSRLPLTITSGRVSVHVGRLNVLTLVPPVNETVRVKLI